MTKQARVLEELINALYAIERKTYDVRPQALADIHELASQAINIAESLKAPR